MGISAGPNNVSDGLVFYIDTANPRSYLGTGTIIYDLVTGGIAGTLTNGPTYNVAQRGGIIFDGVNDYALFGRRADLQGTNITLSVWAKFASLTSGDVAITFGWTDGVNWRQGFGLGTYAGGIRSYLASIEYKANLNTWYHIATSSIGGSNNLYINGIGVSSSVASVVYQSTNLLYAGYGGPGYSSYGKFILGSAKIYNKSLTAAEIKQEYDATKKRYYPDENYVTNNLVLNLDFGNPACYPGSGNTAYDLSGFGHTTSLVNGASYNLLYGGNILCDGVDDYIEATATSALNFGTNNFSVEYWYRKLEYTTGYENIWGPNIWRAGDDNTTNEWSLGIGNGFAGFGESVTFVFQSPSNGIFYKTDTRISGSLNKFNQIVGIRNGGLLELYHNGTLIFSENPGGGFSSSMPLNNINNNLRIANSYLNNYHSKVHSGILRIYNKALSAIEVNQNYQALLPRFSDPSVVTDGLILNYDFGSAETYPGTGSLVRNLTGTGLTGTLTNSPAYSTNSGGSIYLDGTNDYIGVNNNSSLQPANLTLEIWFKLNVVLASQPTGYPLLLDKYSLSSLTGYRLLFERGVDELQFTVFDSVQDNKAAITEAGAKLSTNWNCVQGTFDGNTTKIYLNGILQQTLTRTFSISYNNEDLYLGTYYAVSDGFQHYINAYLGNVRIYNRALTQSEISQNFNATRNKFGI